MYMCVLWLRHGAAVLAAPIPRAIASHTASSHRCGMTERVLEATLNTNYARACAHSHTHTHTNTPTHTQPQHIHTLPSLGVLVQKPRFDQGQGNVIIQPTNESKVKLKYTMYLLFYIIYTLNYILKKSLKNNNNTFSMFNQQLNSQ